MVQRGANMFDTFFCYMTAILGLPQDSSSLKLSIFADPLSSLQKIFCVKLLRPAYCRTICHLPQHSFDLSDVFHGTYATNQELSLSQVTATNKARALTIFPWRHKDFLLHLIPWTYNRYLHTSAILQSLLHNSAFVQSPTSTQLILVIDISSSRYHRQLSCIPFSLF